MTRGLSARRPERRRPLAAPSPAGRTRPRDPAEDSIRSVLAPRTLQLTTKARGDPLIHASAAGGARFVAPSMLLF